jgi:cytoskeletal protein RodZ
MKTIGTFLKESRLKKRYSLIKVENATRIKKEFIEAVEDENWKALPEFPVVVGFVKNIAQFLDLGERSTVALLRRDYPPKNLPINPKPDVGQKFSWNPKLTFITGISIVILAVVTYLGFQYAKFLAPPSLEVAEPTDGQVVSKRSVTVSGKTDGEATVRVNNQPIVTDDDGKFTIQIQIYEGTTEITVKATSRSGKETVVKRMIKPEL